MDITFHYPPELMSLLIDAIPKIFRTKKDVLLFFKGAGVDSSLTDDLFIQLKRDKDSLYKNQTARGHPTLKDLAIYTGKI